MMFGNLRRVVTFAALGVVAVVFVAMLFVVVSRNLQQPAPPPGVPLAASPAEVRVKAVVENEGLIDTVKLIQ